MVERFEPIIIAWYGTQGTEWRRKDWRSPVDMTNPQEYCPVDHLVRAETRIQELEARNRELEEGMADAAEQLRARAPWDDG